MFLAFTVCTNSHLAQAKSMADSLTEQNPHYKVVIGLVDKITADIDVSFFGKHELLEIEKIKIPNFEKLLSQYSLLEMSCLAKPYFAKYFFDKTPSLQKLLFFDSDILIFNELKSVENSLDDYDIIITPHFNTPFEQDGKLPHQRIFLNSGLYNGGFFALKRSDESFRFLDWWAEYVSKEGYINYCEGMGADQLCLNFVPLFFKNVLVETNLGYNVAYWNLHERRVSPTPDPSPVGRGVQYIVTPLPTGEGSGVGLGGVKLLFFHFSGYRHHSPTKFSYHQNRHQWANHPELWPLFDEYRNRLISNGQNTFSKLPNAYFRKPWYSRFEWARGWVIVICRKILRILNG